MAYTITILGTDTTFHQPGPYSKYTKTESLSYISTMIQASQGMVSSAEDSQFTIPTDEVVQYKNAQVAIIDGPTTSGAEVGDRIARGVLIALEAISHGEKDLNLIAHSRGAVESILIAHELERIQTLASGNLLTAKDVISDSVCLFTKEAMNAADHKATFEKLDWSKISANMGSVKVSMLTLDPVPGGNYIAITRIPGMATFGRKTVAWRNPEYFYKLPKIVKEYEGFIFENERTRCFKPIVPSPSSSATKFTIQSLPGHHGTASGNTDKDQQGKPIPEGIGTTAHVQELFILKAIDFLTRNGTDINFNHNTIPAFNQLFRGLEGDRKQFQAKYYELYERIKENIKAYQYFNKTSYQVLGQEHGIDGIIWTFPNERIVHYHGHNDTLLTTFIPPIPGGHFMNSEHARLYLTEQLGLTNKNISLSDMIEHSIRKLLEICSIPTPPATPAESVLVETLEHPETFKILLDSISSLIDEVSQYYIKNSYNKSDEQEAFNIQVNRAFTALKDFIEHNPENKKAKQIHQTFKDNLQKTLTLKREVLKAQYINITHELNNIPILADFQQKVRAVINDLPTDSMAPNVTELKQQLGQIIKTTEEKLSNPSTNIKDYLIEIIGQLGKLHFRYMDNENIDSNILELIEFLNENTSDDDIINYSMKGINLVEEVISSYDDMTQFIEAIPDFKTFDDSVDYEEARTELEVHCCHMIYLLAKYLVSNDVNLETIFKLRSLIKDEKLYKRIEAQIVGLGGPSPLACEIETERRKNSKQEAMIKILQSERDYLKDLRETYAREKLALSKQNEQLIIAIQTERDSTATQEQELRGQLDALTRSFREKESALEEKEQALAVALSEGTLGKEEAARLREEIVYREQAQMASQLEVISLTEQLTQVTALYEQRLASEQEMHLTTLAATKSREQVLEERLTQVEANIDLQRKALEEKEQVLAVALQERMVDKLALDKLRDELIQAQADFVKELPAVRNFATTQDKAEQTDSDTPILQNDEAEIGSSEIISTKLIPLTKDYLLHLGKEIKEDIEPSLDTSTCFALMNSIKRINWPEDQASACLKQKTEAVIKLYEILNSNNSTSREKITQFYQQLNQAALILETHRDPAWKRYLNNVLIVLRIIITGILPGLLSTAISATQSGQVQFPRFWQPKGQTFFKSVTEICNQQQAQDLSHR